MDKSILSSLLLLKLSIIMVMKFSERLKELRKSKNLSQMDLAKETGLSQSAIAKWELDKTEPTASALLKLSEYFGESVDYLLGLEEY